MSKQEKEVSGEVDEEWSTGDAESSTHCQAFRPPSPSLLTAVSCRILMKN